MTKVLFILSAVVMLVASFFAYQNGRQFAQVRTSKAQLHQSIGTELKAVEKVVADVSKVIADVNRVQQELDVETEKAKAQKLKIAQNDGDTKRAQDEMDVQNKKLADLRTQLEKLPQDVKPETLVEDLNRMKQSIAELNSQAELKKKEVDAEAAKVADAQRVLDDIVKKIEERKKAFDRNSMTAQVVAVNNDWGFVVVDAGQSKGITEATKLLVTRGTSTVGKLSIISVQGERTVANIIPESLIRGQSILPGDRVILENLFQ